jgi:Zn-dependent peptidase ImmA (M78 family)
MNTQSRNEKLAQLLGVSIQSLELRLRRSIPLITDKTNKNRANNTRAKNEKNATVMGLDMAEAKLLSGLMVELDKS